MKKKNIYKAATAVVILEIFMKLIAFIKQSIVAYYFGATQATDVYFVANDFMVSVSETIISAAKVAIMGTYATLLVKRGRSSSNKAMSKILMLFVPISIIIIELVIICSPVLSVLLAPSFDVYQNQELQNYIILLSGIVFFTVLIMIFESILNTNEVFVISKIRSLIYSLCVIVACVFAASKGIKVLIAAQYLSFLIYLIIQFVASKKYFKFKFSNPLKRNCIKKIIKLMIPIMIGNSIVRINYLIDKAVASGIGSGGISALAYCQTLDQFVVVVIINSVSSIAFAHFANLVAKKEGRKIISTLNNVLSILFLILLPTTIVVIVEAQNIVGFVYGRGNFSNEMVVLTSIALKGYAIRYVFVGIRDVVVQGLYAYKKVKKPMLNSLFSTIVNIFVSVMFVKKIGILSIALGTSASAIVGAFLNARAFKKENGYRFLAIKRIIIKSIPACTISIVLGLFIINVVNIPGTLEIIIFALIVYLTYFMIMYLLGVKELKNLVKIIKSKILHK